MIAQGISALFIAFLVSGSALAAAQPKDRIVCICGQMHFALFISNADGSNERRFLDGTESNYNASFSANGQWIIFTSERSGKAEIYRAHPDGSALEQLTSSRSYADQGALSPDGKTLAFVSTRDGGRANIWLLDLVTHHVMALAKNRSGSFRPSWSPDGKWIAFSSDRDTSAGRNDPAQELLQLTAIYLIHPDGTGLRRLTSLNKVSGSPRWSPDGQHIVFYQADNIGGVHIPSWPAVPQIVSIDMESGKEVALTSDDDWKLSPQFVDAAHVGYSVRTEAGKGFAYVSGQRTIFKGSGGTNSIFPSWSPDGKTVVYQRSEDLSLHWMRPVRSSDSRYELLQYANTFSFPALSPDGKQVIYPSVQKDKLEIMNIDGSNIRDLFDGGAVSVAWSPDGQVAFGLGAQIAMIRSDGSNLRMLTEGNNSNSFPSFSPDGKYLVFRVRGSERGLRIMTLADGHITKLTGERDDFPAWSPLGDRIIFTGYRTGTFEVYSIRSDGTGLRQLTHDNATDGHGIWSPDGNWIAFASSRAGWKDEGIFLGGRPYGEIFVMRSDGSDVRQLTDNQWEDGPVLWLPLSSGHSGRANVAAN